MKRNFINYIILFSIFVIVDTIWLAIVAVDFYQTSLKPLLTFQPNFLGIGLFYLSYPIGTMYFCRNKPILDAAMFGGFTYATYELTNFAVVAGWPWQLVIVDIVWGVSLTTFCVWLTQVIMKRFYSSL